MNIKINKNALQNIFPGVGKMAKLLKALAPLPEDPGLIPSIHMATPSYL